MHPLVPASVPPEHRLLAAAAESGTLAAAARDPKGSLCVRWMGSDGEQVLTQLSPDKYTNRNKWLRVYNGIQFSHERERNSDPCLLQYW